MKVARWTMTAMALALMLTMPGTAMAKAKRHAHKAAAKVTGTVNLNTATAEQLKSLPGMSQKAVTAIIDYRKAQPFSRVEEIVKVKGFGKKRFETLKPNLSVSGETRFKVEKPTSASKTTTQASASTVKKSKGQGRNKKKHTARHSKKPPTLPKPVFGKGVTVLSNKVG